MFILCRRALFISLDDFIHGNILLKKLKDVIPFLIDGLNIADKAILLFPHHLEIVLEFFLLMLHLLYPLFSLD